MIESRTCKIITLCEKNYFSPTIKTRIRQQIKILNLKLEKSDFQRIVIIIESQNIYGELAKKNP